MRKFGVTPLYMQLYRAKKMAIDIIEGGHASSYGLLTAYAKIVEKANPDSLDVVFFKTKFSYCEPTTTLVASIDNSPSAAVYDDPLTHHSPSPLGLSNSLESELENIAFPQVVTTSNRETMLSLSYPGFGQYFHDKGNPSCVLRHSERSRQQNNRLKDYVCITARCVDICLHHYQPQLLLLKLSLIDFLIPLKTLDGVMLEKEIVALESNGLAQSRISHLASTPSDGSFQRNFCSCCKMVYVRTFLTVVVARDWALHQMDVHNAFLHSDLDEEVYMRLPPGFSISTPGKVDDLIIAGNDPTTLSQFKAYMSRCFHMKDLG
ncbi:Retrovirus-related Pol polyprotein from transposon TNT 1-94 [Sesamum angolense]|uniref:Retrovirus-related Pol polyprotein from transposon TNT 1-94 n=1 Tax=Sesamum angolense TaxID=2727404 RepID=A0AAE1W7I2_9LAMI|nr:Retrovirus-related Pol polyprotein from transposon TNT 1-94 [Sesamum angolense]